MNETMLEKYADVLTWALKIARDGRFRKNDLVLLRFDLAALELGEIMYEKLVAAGWNTVFRLGATSRMERSFFDLASGRQLVYKTPGDKELFENLNGVVSLLAPDSLTHLAGVDPKRIAKAIVSRKYLREIMETRESRGLLGWTLCLFPTKALAKSAGLSVKQYTEQVVKACYLDSEDPVAEWRRIYRKAQAVKKKLNALDIETLRVQTENTDLTVTPGRRRRWLGVSGHNIPSFEIFTSPDWRGTEGVYYSDQPSYRSGNLVKGVRLTFKRGKAVEVQAEKGEQFVRQQLDMDPGARRLGEFSLTDRRFSRIDRFMAHTLYDENFGGDNGNCHVAVGASYADTYDGDQAGLTKAGKQKLGYNDSALHWDLVNTEPKTVTARLAHGKTRIIYEDGEFRV